MTKMNMVWIAVASLLHPKIESNLFVRKPEIESKVRELFNVTITPVMIDKHLVNSEDRQADPNNPSRGGSRNRYLVRGAYDNFRLYKQSDSESDAWDKTGPTCPDSKSIDPEYEYLVTWYERMYVNS
ncbi:MAG: hypothetical protein F4Y68_20295 [Boseongicola sp. SB0665_bin_10]|nr:hypothetical protein [Boseongicola sp. SB0665_bin_10]